MNNFNDPSLIRVPGNSVTNKYGTRRDKDIIIIYANYLKNVRQDLNEEEIVTKPKGNDAIVYMEVEINQRRTLAMVDTGANASLIDSIELQRLETECKIIFPKLPINNVTLIGATGRQNKTVKRQTMMELESQGTKLPFIFLIAQGLPFGMLVGCDMLRKYKAVINLQRNIITLHTDNITWTARLCGNHFGTHRQLNNVLVRRAEADRVQTPNITNYEDQIIWDTKLDEIREFCKTQDQGQLRPEDAEKLIKIYEEFRHVFSDAPGKVKDFQCKIRFHEAANFQRKSYPIAHSLKNAVREEITRMMTDDIIEYSQSPYTSPVVAIPKKNGSVRLCLDAREINKIIINDRTSPGEIEELLKRFYGTRYFSTWDTVCGYWQVELHPESRQYMAFLFDGRNYQFKRLPFGLVNSVAVFVKCMDQVLGPDTLKFTTVYVDDLLVTSEDWDEHCRRVRQVLTKLSDNHVTLKLDKSRLIAKDITFLGHVLTSQGIKPSPEKIEAIQNFPKPNKRKHLQSFLGLCNYYRKFQNNYSALTSKFKKQLSAKDKWHWGPEEDQTFDNIKEKFLETVMLRHPNFKDPFYMNCDASDTSLGAELYQEDEEGNHLVVSFASRILNESEKNYSVTEKELLSIVFACNKFRTYILGYKITVRTDHKSISFLRNCKLSHGRLTRWTLALQEYNISWEYVPGRKNVVADCLSRVNWEKDTLEEDKGKQLLIYNYPAINLNLRDIINRLKEEQELDPKLSNTLSKLRNGDETIGKYYCQHDKVLFIRPNELTNQWKIVVPNSIERTLINDYHIRYGHMGTLKVAKAIAEHFFIKNLPKKVTREIRTCHLCQLTKTSNEIHEGRLIPITSNYKLEKTFLDICGPFPRSGGRHRYKFIVIILDHFSRYIKLYPVTRATTRNILRIVIEEYMTNIGKPHCIITDHGTQFRGMKWKQQLLDQGVKTYKTAVYHPSSNPAERVLREVGRILRTYCHHNQRKWSEYIQLAEDSINCSYHHYLDETPYTVMFGRPPPRQIRELIDFPTNTIEEYDIIEFHNRMATKTEKLKGKYEDNKHSKINYKPGDKILLKNRELPSSTEGIMKKLLLLYTGPYVISKDHGDNTYEIKDPKTDKIMGRYNQSSMKPYVERQE